MSYSSEVLADSPTHFWKLWDASGASAVDSSGNARNATYNASPTLHATSPLDVDASAFAVTLNGTTQYISRAAEASINSAPWCFEIIAKVGGGAGTFRVVASTRDENTNNGWLLYLNDTNHFDLRHGAGGTVIASAATYGVGTTVHIVVGHNGTKFFMYINSVLEATNPTIAYTASTTALNIGRRTDAAFFGPFTVQHAAHYSSMLSQARVTAHYNAATTIAPATGSGTATFAAIPSLDTQTIIDSQATSFALVPNSIGNIIASGGITVGLTPAISNQTLEDAGVVNLTLVPAGTKALVVSQATETDSAFAVSVLKNGVLGQALETDSAGVGFNFGQAKESELGQPVTHQKTVTVTQAQETDTSLAVQLGAKVIAVTQATETDQTLALVGGGRSFSVTQATESDIAQAVKHVRLENVTQPSATDTGQPVTHRKTIHPTQVIETDLAQAVTRVRIVHVGQALEADLAHGVTHSRAFNVGQVIEGDTSQTVISVRTFHVGEATETDQSQAATSARTKHVGQALETDTPLPFPKFIDVGQAFEIDLGEATTVRRSFLVGQGLELDGASAFEFTRGHTYRVRTGQEFAFSPHANPKKVDHVGIVKRVRTAYEAVYSHPVNER